MFKLFKGNTDDVKVIRASILQFVKEQLQKMESNEGRNIKSLNLYIDAMPKEQHLYEAALYTHDETQLREALQKMADDYALALPADWLLSIVFSNDWPSAAIKATKLKVGLQITAHKKAQVAVQSQGKAIIRILNGEAEKTAYLITPESGNINIGRERQLTTVAGFIRQNHIAFLGQSTNEANRSVSRQHAHIEWREDTQSFMLFADEGGIPPNNKTKIKSEKTDAIKLQSTATGYQLRSGDQIVLGESATIQFNIE